MLSDSVGSPNVVVRELLSGEERTLTLTKWGAQMTKGKFRYALTARDIRKLSLPTKRNIE